MIGLLAALAVAASAPPASDPKAQLAELERLYQQSCADRAYGSYNDVCNDMRDQIRAYRRQAAHDARRPAAAPVKP